ncbi:unnamed protein product [Closterium sp. Naga37s-1]|nr:unnamed protein product [Closterium sp. Naga37s-1]
MATRLKKVLSKVLSKEHHCFLPGKSLADAVSMVADAVEAANNEKEDWLLLLVYFQKAYDTVAREYLFRVMQELGVPAAFIGWTRGLHVGAGTKVIVNGWLRNKVEMDRGVRQGCPLAPYLFLCALEPLCRATGRRKLGVGPANVELLSYVGYADNTSFLLSGENQLREAVEVLEIFGKQSGLKLDPKVCLDGLAVRRIGKLLSKPDATRRWLAEKAACFPQGLATLHAHPSAGKRWEQGSERWKAAVKISWKSSFASLPEPASRWEVAEEILCFNRRIMHRGESPFGHKKGTEGLLNTRIRDLITEGAGGRRVLKEEEVLALELGSTEAAAMAMKAYRAIPPEWRVLVEEPVSAEAVQAVAGVVRYVNRGQPSELPWAVKDVTGTKLNVALLLLNEEGALEAPAKAIGGCFEACRVQPMVVRENMLVGPVGDPKTMLLAKSGLFVGGKLEPLRKIRAALSKVSGRSWRQAEWETLWGKKIDWKRAITV